MSKSACGNQDSLPSVPEFAAFLPLFPNRPHEAAEAGLYKSADGSTYPRPQILTIKQILDGNQPAYNAHRHDATFKEAPRSRLAPAKNLNPPLSD